MAIYNGTQKISVSGVDKVYVGTQLVYQKTPVLESIAIAGYTSSYKTYATFSLTGTVTATYSNGTTANVTANCTTNTPNMTTAGSKTITVSYTENNITKTTQYTITVSKAWRTIYNNSTGKKILSITNKVWTKDSVPANVSANAEQLKITFKIANTYKGAKITWSNGGSHATSNTYTESSTNTTKTFTYDQGHDILYVVVTGSQNNYTSTSYIAKASWFRNGFSTSDGGQWMGNGSWSFTVTKLEEYY